MSSAVKAVTRAIVKIVKVIVKAVKFVVNAVIGFVKALASGDPAIWVMTIALILAGPAGWAYLTWTQVAVMGAMSMLATQYQVEKAEKLQSQAERELAQQEAEAKLSVKSESDDYFNQMEEDRYNSYYSNTFGSDPVLTSGDGWIQYDVGDDITSTDSESTFNFLPLFLFGGGFYLFSKDDNESIKEPKIINR